MIISMVYRELMKKEKISSEQEISGWIFLVDQRRIRSEKNGQTASS